MDWLWLLLSFYFGGLFGFFIAAMMALNGRASEWERREELRRAAELPPGCVPLHRPKRDHTNHFASGE